MLNANAKHHRLTDGRWIGTPAATVGGGIVVSVFWCRRGQNSDVVLTGRGGNQKWAEFYSMDKWVL